MGQLSRIWNQIRDIHVIGNGLKGLAMGLLCNIYIFGRDNLESVFEAIVIWIRLPNSEMRAEALNQLYSRAGDLTLMSRRMIEGGTLLVGLLVIVSCILFGLWDGVRERRIRDLQSESEIRARHLEAAQEKLTDVQRRLAHTERLAAIGRMAAGVSHEINNPLGAISGHIRLLDMQLSEEDEHRPMLEVMRKETRRIQEIVKGLNDFARNQPDPRELRETVADIGEIVEETLASFRPKLKESGVRVERYFESEDFKVFGRKDQLRQSVNNLISNAIEAMPEGGCLSVRIYHSRIDRTDLLELRGHFEEAGRETAARRVFGGEQEFSLPEMLKEGTLVLRLEIADTGIGMPEELLSRIFEPFVTTKEIGYGLGLGLAITYSIIRNHGGYIEVRSEEGEGTRFTVSLASAGPEAPAGNVREKEQIVS